MVSRHEKEFRLRHDLVDGLGSREVKVQAYVGIGRVEQACTFVVEDGLGKRILTVITIAEVEIHLSALAVLGNECGIESRRLCELFLCIGRIGLSLVGHVLHHCRRAVGSSGWHGHGQGVLRTGLHAEAAHYD